jgi:hypothetical protein
VRTDKNSSFGANFPAIYYPKFDVSYVLSKESYFPVVPGLENLRLRAAFGQSGRQPGTTDATRYYLGATYADVAADAPALSFHALGNPGLRPEVTQEFETGFDAAFLNNRFTVDATYYRKTTRDGLVERPLAPSLGTAASQFANLGQVRNVGYELLGTANLIDRRQFGFELAVNFARNDNTLLELGEGIPPIVGATRQQREGFPLNGLWQRPLTSFADANGDNIITPNEIVVGDTAVFIGREDPRTTVQFTPTVRLLSGRLRLSANVDRQTGFFRLNGTDRIRCESRNNCRGAIDRTAPLWEQARAVAVREHPSRTQAGFMERGDFTRLREISAAFDVPGRLLTPLRASGAALRFGVRNVRFWSDYSGIDPESNYFDTNGLGTISDFQTAPPPTLYTLRLDLRF